MTTKAPPIPTPLEKIFENLFFVTIAGRMLLPNQRVRSHCEQVFPIFRSKRPNFKKIANEVRLQFKRFTPIRFLIQQILIAPEQLLAATKRSTLWVDEYGTGSGSDRVRSNHKLECRRNMDPGATASGSVFV